MELKDFVKHTKEDVEEFEAWWERNRRKNKNAFPGFMKPADWADQFQSFLDTRRNDET